MVRWRYDYRRHRQVLPQATAVATPYQFTAYPGPTIGADGDDAL